MEMESESRKNFAVKYNQFITSGNEGMGLFYGNQLDCDVSYNLKNEMTKYLAFEII